MSSFNINKLFIAYLTISPAFVVIGAFDQAGRIKLLLLLMCLVYSFSKKGFSKVFSVKTIFFWGCWSLFSFINWHMIGHISEDIKTWTFIMEHFVYPLSMLIFVYYESCKDKEGTCKVVLYSFVVFVLMGVLFQDVGTGEGTDWEARGGEILGNSLALNACVLGFVAAFAYINKFIDWKKLFFVLLLSLVAIFFVATRKALGGLGIILIFLVFARFFVEKPRKLGLVLFLCLSAYAFFYYIVDNTMIGRRMTEMEEQDIESLTGNAFFDLFGDRAMHYLLGWDMFLENPIAGVGIKNSILYSGLPYPLHTEYMTQLAEGGIIGTVLYLLFMISLIWITLKYMHRRNLQTGLICISGILCVLFISFTGWIYQFPFYFILFGMVLANCKPIRFNNVKKIHVIFNKTL